MFVKDKYLADFKKVALSRSVNSVIIIADIRNDTVIPGTMKWYEHFVY